MKGDPEFGLALGVERLGRSSRLSSVISLAVAIPCRLHQQKPQ
jgi:hypothetical protein